MKTSLIHPLHISCATLLLALGSTQGLWAADEAPVGLIVNSNLETDTDGDQWPDGWSKGNANITWEVADGNHFLRIAATEPDKLLLQYQAYAIPAGADALDMSWRQRVTGFQVGKKPWFDARIIFEFIDASGKTLVERPDPAYTQYNTDGWEKRSTHFLVPKEARKLAIMPCLFQVNAGTLDLDDLILKPTDPAPVIAEKEAQKKAEVACYVAPEAPNRSKWPKTLHVAGNLILDESGKEIWLQGVNVPGLESLPFDEHALKSTQVAIEDWKANCIRLPIKEDFWFGKSPYQNGSQAFRDLIDQIVTFAANRGVYIVLDLYRFRAPKQEHADFWKDVSTKYANHPAVLFDVFNEPYGISWEVWRDGGFVGKDQGTDESAFLSDEEKKNNQSFESIGMQALVDAVRSTGSKNIVIAGGLSWCTDLSGIVNGYALDDKGGNGIVYSWHTYNWHPGWAKVLPIVEKHPVFLGECGGDVQPMGFIPLADQEDPNTFNPDLLGFVQKHRIHWAGFCMAPIATPRLILDWNYTPTPFWGTYVKEALGGKQFEMKRMR